MATIKQKKAFFRIAENHGNISKSMLEVGYSKNTAKKPSNLTKTKGWQELMNEFLPDEHLLKKHQEFLNAPRQIRTYKKGELMTETEETDPSAVRALDIGYKIKGRYQDGNYIDQRSIVLNISNDKAQKLLNRKAP